MGKTVLYKLGERLPSGGIPLPTVRAGMDIVVSGSTITIEDDSGASGAIDTWSYQLVSYPAGAVIDTKTTQNPSFTSVSAGDYRIIQTVSSNGVYDARTSDVITVVAAALATPTGLATGTVSGLTVPLTFDIPAVVPSVDHRRLLYGTATGLAKGQSNFVTLSANDTSYDFVASGAGTWFFALYDVAVSGLASDSGLTSEVSAVVASSGSPPGDFSLNPPTAVSPHRIDLSWTASEGAGQYSVYRDTVTPVVASDLTDLQREIGAETTQISDNTVAPATTYYYVIQSFNGHGSKYSNELSATTPEQGEWPDNEPPGMTTLVINADCTSKLFPGTGFTTSADWQTGTLSDGVTPRVEVVQDSTAKHGFCIRKHYEIGDDSGFHGKMIKTSMHPVGFREMFYRMVFRVSPNFQWHSGAQKIYYCGFKQTSNPTHMMIESDGTIQFKPTYQSGGCTTGTRVFKAPGIKVSRGVWHTHEFHFVAQSAVGVADGSASFWWDGDPITNWTCVGSVSYCTGLSWVNGTSLFQNMAWQPACAPNHLLSGFEGPMFWGGSSDFKDVNDYFDLGELYIVGKL